MNFEYAVGTLKSHDPKDVARLMYDFFRHQYERSTELVIDARARKSGALAANQAAKCEYEREDSLGWGPKYPYDEATLKRMDEECETAKKQKADAKACLDFVVNRFIDGFLTEDKNETVHQRPE